MATVILSARLDTRSISCFHAIAVLRRRIRRRTSKRVSRCLRMGDKIRPVYPAAAEVKAWAFSGQPRAVRALLPLVVGSSSANHCRFTDVSDGCCRFEAQCNRLRRCPSLRVSSYIKIQLPLALPPKDSRRRRRKLEPHPADPDRLVGMRYKDRVTLQTSPTE